MNKNITLFLGILALLSFSCKNQNTSTEINLLIKNAQIIDGSGAEPYYGQILIIEDEIFKIEKDTSLDINAERIIDARGSMLTPGFIDSHAHGDPMETPAFENFLAMGVTSIFLGQDGFSPETIDLKGWMDSVDQIKPGVNVGMFVGHGTLRMLSGVQYDKTPTDSGMRSMENLVNSAMEAGCFGLSTGLEYNPGYLAGPDELNRLAKVVGKKGGMIMSHMRNEDDAYIEASLKELLDQGEFCPVHVSHIKVVYGKGEERAAGILAFLDNARGQGKTVTADLYPYEASYTSISILFPEWALPPADYSQVMAERRGELETYLRNRVNLRNGPEATLIGNGPYKGKTLKEVGEILEKPFEKVLIEDIGPSGTSAAYFVMDEVLMKALLVDEHVNICSDGSPTSNHPRGYGTFAKIIESYVIKEPILSLPEAIYKMTGLTAQSLGIHDRGLIREGMKADLLVFDPEAVRANATYENPAQLAEGFDYVLVNGQIAKEKDVFSNQSGKIIKKAKQ
ncbi:N-acyl-D-amino-acid deacylase family protein [Pararhodonellum marinum]|uniref:N-acyl-D-amino-acid deacylase family protein n=1 Tax=Pararhodonellum marinum TaxID=2755358 RepID=UPI00188F8938|nr:amidohydrolase family protein [Pararhodonellum marinum]